MPAFTNMAWPEDPYGTGQLWRREPPLLAAFSVHKCSQVRWWPLRQLPAGTYPYTAEGIGAYLRGEHYSLVGWPAHATRR